MTQSQITYFLAVARHLSFSKAAEELYVSQPAVSKQISLMEEELGFSLFDRTRQGTQLTQSGIIFQEMFDRCTQLYQHALESARRVNNTIQGEVRIGCVEGWDLSEFYPHLFDFFSENYPNVKLHLAGYNFDSMFSALCHGHVDVIITLANALKAKQGITSYKLTDVNGILLYSARHAKAHKPDLCPDDFADEPFYVTAPDSGKELQSQSFIDALGGHFTPRVELLPTLSSVFMKLQSGRGVIFSNDWMMAKNNPLFSYLSLNIKRTVNVAWMTDNESPSKHLFVNELLFYFKQLSDAGAAAPGLV